jgi:hypothetical protein
MHVKSTLGDSACLQADSSRQKQQQQRSEQQLQTKSAARLRRNTCISRLQLELTQQLRFWGYDGAMLAPVLYAEHVWLAMLQLSRCPGPT